jgi:hypothetical protein
VRLLRKRARLICAPVTLPQCRLNEDRPSKKTTMEGKIVLTFDAFYAILLLYSQESLASPVSAQAGQQTISGIPEPSGNGVSTLRK